MNLASTDLRQQLKTPDRTGHDLALLRTRLYRSAAINAGMSSASLNVVKAGYTGPAIATKPARARSIISGDSPVPPR